jgi:hypothetical protein
METYYYLQLRDPEIGSTQGYVGEEPEDALLRGRQNLLNPSQGLLFVLSKERALRLDQDG